MTNYPVQSTAAPTGTVTSSTVVLKPECSVAGCKRCPFVGVGAEDSQLCRRHFEAWLRDVRTVSNQLAMALDLTACEGLVPHA